MGSIQIHIQILTSRALFLSFFLFNCCCCSLNCLLFDSYDGAPDPSLSARFSLVLIFHGQYMSRFSATVCLKFSSMARMFTLPCSAPLALSLCAVQCCFWLFYGLNYFHQHLGLYLHWVTRSYIANNAIALPTDSNTTGNSFQPKLSNVAVLLVFQSFSSLSSSFVHFAQIKRVSKLQVSCQYPYP